MDPPIPSSFKVGNANGDGDCFYDSVAQCLKQEIPNSIYTVKMLRELCKNYANQQIGNKNSWLRGALENKTENQNMDYYISCIEYCADDIASTQCKVPNELQNPIWGRPEIEGRIICGILNLRLHVIEKHIVLNETICMDEVVDNNDTKSLVCEGKEDVNEKSKPAIEVWYNQVVDGSGSKSVESVEYDGHDTIHIVNAGDLHFKPILRKHEVPNQESGFSSLSSSDEINDEMTELGEKLISTVRSQISEEEKVAALLKILQQGGDVNFKDANRNCSTAMHFAAKLNLPKVFKCLCEHGADASLKNSKNRTPLEMTSRSQSHIFAEILNPANDDNKMKLSQIEIDAIILKEFIAPRSHLEEIKDIIESYGHSLTEDECTKVNYTYMDLCLKYWLQEIRATMIAECRKYTIRDIEAIQTLDQVPAPFQDANFYKRLIQIKDLVDEDHKKFGSL